MINFIKDFFFGKLPFGAKRSSKWHKVRAEYLKEHPLCECCGGKAKLEVHHCFPFWLFPDLELVKSNLKTLCEKQGCHFSWGHLYSWKSYNSTIEEDLKVWKSKIIERP